LGCTGESIVGADQEIEERPALALWAAHLPGVSVQPMHLEFERTAEGHSFVGWPDELGDKWPSRSSLLLLGEPFSFPADVLLERLNEDQPGVQVLGGMASGAASPGENRLLLGRRELTKGAVAALIHGPVRLSSVVSQGCRPIGRPLVITRAEQNVIQELSGKPALVQLREVFQSLSADEQRLVQHGLHVGRVVNEYQGEFGRGDFLVRNVVGADPDSGAIAIGDWVRVGQTVQFHLRDAQTADEDLQELLTAARRASQPGPAGALVFTCNGRGTRLFSQPHHDAHALASAWGDVPVAGFFAQGEIGPVGGKNFLHGFTASVVIFETMP
jgi:small ligand-binding sensory domain FIST